MNCRTPCRFVSLVPKVEIADGDDQSQKVISWLLIALSLLIWGMAIVQCCFEVRAVGKKHAPFSSPLSRPYPTLSMGVGFHFLSNCGKSSLVSFMLATF